jgi:hypothetical protein
MNFFEEIVHEHLTADLKLFVKPNLVVERNESGKPWGAQIDLVALDPAKKTLYLVEVTGLRGVQKYFNDKLHPDARKTIEAWALKDLNLGGLGLRIQWLLFVRRPYVDKTKDLPTIKKMIAEGICDVRPLEQLLEAR